MCAGHLMVGPNWLSPSWSCWKCSHNCTRSLWGLVSLLYLTDVLLSSSSMLWVVGVVSRGVGSWVAGISSALLYMKFDHCISLLCCEFSGISHNCGAVLWKMTVYSFGTSICGSMLMLRMRQRKSLTSHRLCWASWEVFWVLSLNPFGWWKVSTWSIYSAGIINCYIVRYPVKAPV